jgi:hypothetical protein
MKQVEELMAKMVAEHSEPLNPALVPYLEQSDMGWAMLRHPLVYQVPFFSNGSANAFYEQKRNAVEKAIEDKNFKQFVWLFERPYRLEAFTKIADKLSDTDYWKLLSDIWVDTENQYAHLEEWKKLLASKRPNRHYMMTEEEDNILRALSQEVTIYRGCQKGINEDGLSWTLDKSKAKFFANRFGKKGIILERTISKNDIVAVLLGRGESEVVCEVNK